MHWNCILAQQLHVKDQQANKLERIKMKKQYRVRVDIDDAFFKDYTVSANSATEALDIAEKRAERQYQGRWECLDSYILSNNQA